MSKLQAEEDLITWYMREYGHGAASSLDQPFLGWFCRQIDADEEFGRIVEYWTDSDREMYMDPMKQEQRNEYGRRMEKYRKRWIRAFKRLVDKGILEASWEGTGPGGQHDGFGKRARRYDLKGYSNGS